jgi:hypothetical protein
LVICNAAPSNIEKTKKMAMRFSLKSVNARSPSVSTHDLALTVRSTGQPGSENE